MTRTFKCDVMWLLNGDSSHLDGDTSLSPLKCDVAYKIANKLKFIKIISNSMVILNNTSNLGEL